jgi:hypothetical protein
MEMQAMKKKRSSRVWLWVLLVVTLAALGYYLYTQMAERPEETPVAEKETSEPSRHPSKPPVDREEKIQASEPTPPTESAGEAEQLEASDELDCGQMEEDIASFFRYLDKQPYIQQLEADLNTRARFREIVQKLTSQPPVPAGEGTDQRIMIGNLYHLFRTLSRQDIQLIRTVIQNEQGAVEVNLRLFYRWFTARERCPDPENMRPSFPMAYSYAGFFLNTTGGRAYLYRRPTGLRLLLSYYCLLILHEADRKGLNSYGINTAGFIRPLRDEIIHYPDLQFQRDYVERLSRMEAYYLHKR